MLNFCKVDVGDGSIIYEKNVTSAVDKIRIALIARYLANKLEPNIPADVSLEQLVEYTGIDQKIVSARLTEIVSEGFGARVGSGLYRVVPFYMEKFLEHKLIYTSVSKSKKATQSTSKRTGKSIVQHILILKDENFFNESKRDLDILTELEAHGFHYRRTSLTKPLQLLVRKQELSRLKTKLDGSKKEVWVYVNP